MWKWSMGGAGGLEVEAWMLKRLTPLGYDTVDTVLIVVLATRSICDRIPPCGVMSPWEVVVLRLQLFFFSCGSG